MGWKFATAYCQMAHRRMVVLGHRLPCTLTAPGGCSCLPEAQEVRRDRAVPVNGCRHARDAWSIYIDNLDLWEIFEQDDAIRLRGTVAPFMTAAEKCYHVWNSPGSPEDLADRLSSFKLLGVENDGVLGRRDVPKECHGRLISLFMFLALSPRVSKRDLQVAAGRGLRFILRNRCTNFCFDNIWRAISTWERRGPVPKQVVSEFLTLLCVLPLCYSDLRLQVSAMPSCTDASYGGGGACVATNLSKSGERKARRLHAPREHRSGSELGIFSMFDGVGGARRAMELLDLPVALFVSVELDKRRQRVCKSNWPHVVHYPDVTKISEREM